MNIFGNFLQSNYEHSIFFQIRYYKIWTANKQIHFFLHCLQIWDHAQLFLKKDFLIFLGILFLQNIYLFFASFFNFIMLHYSNFMVWCCQVCAILPKMLHYNVTWV